MKSFTDKRTGEVTRSPMAPATMARAERCRRRFGEFPAVLMPAKAVRGVERHPWQPMAIQTSQQETAILSTGAVIAAHRHNGDGKHISQPMDTVTTTHEKALLAAAVDNYQGVPRGVGEPLATQGGSETMALVSAGVMPFRQNTIPTGHGEPMPTVTADQVPGLLTAAHEPGPARGGEAMLFGGWYKQNGSRGTETAPHPLSDPVGTLTAHDTTALLTAQWREALAGLRLEDCHFRMMGAHEIGRGCGFDVDFPDHRGAFVVWGSARDQVDGFGNAVSPPVGEWIGARLRKILA